MKYFFAYSHVTRSRAQWLVGAALVAWAGGACVDEDSGAALCQMAEPAPVQPVAAEAPNMPGPTIIAPSDVRATIGPRDRPVSAPPAAGIGAARERDTGCPDRDGVTPCDIVQASCQRALFSLAKCLRGDSPAPLPPIEVLSDAEFTRRLLTPEEPATDMPEQEQEQAQRAMVNRSLTLLRLMQDEPEKANADDSVARTAAVYYPTKKAVLVRRAGETTSESSNATLLHELIHALQDAELDLSTLHTEASTYDQLLTRIAFVEGEAVMYEMFGRERFQGRKVDWARFHDDLRERLDAAYRSSRNPIVAARMTFPYSYGTRFVTDTWQAGGPKAVRALFDTELGTGDLMRHAVRAQPLARGPKLVAPSSDTDEQALTAQDGLGAFIQFGLFPGDDAAAFDAATALADDRLDLFVTEVDEPVAVWRQRWATMRGRDAFARFTEQLTAGAFQLSHEDGVTTLIATESPAALERWLANETP